MTAVLERFAELLATDCDLALTFSLSPMGALRQARTAFEPAEYQVLVSVGLEQLGEIVARYAEQQTSEYRTNIVTTSSGGLTLEIVPRSVLEITDQGESRLGDSHLPLTLPDQQGESHKALSIPCELRPPYGPKGWGLLANPGCFDGAPYKGVYFMPGEAWSRHCVGHSAHSSQPSINKVEGCASDGPSPLGGGDCFRTDLHGRSARELAQQLHSSHPVDVTDEFDSGYIVIPQDPRFARWFSEPGAKEFIVNEMVSMGFNVIEMETYPPAPPIWRSFAQQRQSPCAEASVFRTAAERDDILVLPWILRVPNTDQVWESDPGIDVSGVEFFVGNPAPQALDAMKKRVLDLVNQFLINPEDPNWRTVWAQMYNQKNEPRFAIGLYKFCSAFEDVPQTAFRDFLDELWVSV